MYIQATKLRVGTLVIFQGQPHRVMYVQHVTPGKGQATVQTKLRNLITGNQRDQRFRSTEQIERATLENKSMQYLYSEGTQYHFMDTETYEQVVLDKETISDQIGFLKENMKIQIQFFDDRPVSMELPSVVELKVVETEPEIKGATATASLKPAILETGLKVKVPQFIRQGDVIRVSTEKREYIERA
ncbi:elongation factor P [Bdellovibrionota bacterium]